MGKPISFEGRTIEVPDDATDAEVATILSSYPRQGFETLPGGAAIVQPRQPARPLRGATGTELATDIAGATALGTVGGLVTPQILQAGGTALKGSGISYLQLLGGGLSYLGTLAAAAGPAARAAAGAFSGFGSESLGKTAEAAGAGPVTAEVARFVGGGVTPEFAKAAALLTTNIMSRMLPGDINSAALRTLSAQIAAKLRDASGRELSDEQKAYTARLVADLHGSQKPGVALGGIGGEMETGAQGVLRAGERQAENVAFGGELAAQRVTESAAQTAARIAKEAEKRSAALYANSQRALNESRDAAAAEIALAEKGQIPYGQASQYLTTLRDDVINAAKGTRLTIGEDRPATTIGKNLRDVAVKQKDDFQTAASDKFKATEAVVNKGVAKLENAGITIDKNPAYKKLVAELEAELAPGKNSPDVAAGYKKILDQITVKVKKGEPAVSPSYNAIDQARRLLGESFGNVPVEGYKNIDKIARQNMYGKLRDLQVKFGGDKVDDLLSNYADSRPELAQFGSAAGKKMTGMDRGALEQFATDPENLPAYFFKTPTSFQNLVDLVGDRKLAVSSALDYATNALTGKETSSAVRAWMTKNPGFLNAVPEVKLAVSKHETALAAAEKTAASIDYGVKDLTSRQAKLGQSKQTYAKGLETGGELQMNALAAEAKGVTKVAATESKNMLTQASKDAEKLIDKANLESGKISSESIAAADKIWNRKSVSKELNARELIESGDATQWALVAPIIERSPAAKGAMYDAVRQVLADGPVSAQRFNEVIAAPMIKFGMLGATEATALAKQLAVLEARHLPPAQELGFKTRIILEAIGGYSSTLGTRGVRTGAGFVLGGEDYIPDSNSPTRRNQNSLRQSP